MNLNISGHHMDMTDALRTYVTGKMEKVERRFDNVIDADVVLEVKRERRKAQATIKISGATLHAEAEQTDMYAAIDAMIDKLDRQTTKFKEKLTDHRNKEGMRTAATANADAEANADLNAAN